MKGYAYIDFETSKTGEFYLVGVSIEGEFEQIVLTADLRGLAEQHSLRLMEPESFALHFLNLCEARGLCVAAYSNAEKETLEQLAPGFGLKYLNLRKGAKKWIRRFRRREFENLPQLAERSRITSGQRRQLRNSLYSVSRLLGAAGPERLPRPPFSTYGHRRTSGRFKAVMDALHRRGQDYSRLTPVQKAKGTKALGHNHFDVQVLPRLHAAIEKCDPKIVSASISVPDAEESLLAGQLERSPRPPGLSIGA